MVREFFKVISTVIVISLIIGAISGAGVSYYLLNKEKSQNSLIKNFYETENAVYVSPHSLRVKMSKNDFNFTLVDLRSPEEYAREHIKGAINIPLQDKNFEKKVAKKVSNKNKKVVVYCANYSCQASPTSAKKKLAS